MTFSGCSRDSGAKWDGCDSMSFESYLKKGFAGMFADLDAKAKVSVSREETWPEGLNLSALSEGCTAVTYKVTLSMENSNMDFLFFMEQNELLAVKGARTDHQGILTPLDEAQATDVLKELNQYIN